MNTVQTKSGIYFRRGKSGSAVYSPFTGKFFAIDPQFDSAVQEWLDFGRKAVPQEIQAAIGPGWVRGLGSNGGSHHSILPDDRWGFMNSMDHPLLINWLLTGNCAFECPYCYAQDLMNGRCKEPTEGDVERIAKHILSFQPLAVVLTGGDPLLSPHLQYAIDLLQDSTGVIVDTSGFRMSEDHIESFCINNVFVRISLDSELMKQNGKLRPMKLAGQDSGTVALKAISQCLARNVNLGVQTVATVGNYGDLESLGNKLQKLGVSNWRIMFLAHTAETHEVFQKLQLSKRQVTRFRKNIYPKIKSLPEVCKSNVIPAVHLAENDVPNAVILVSPDGVFYTESIARSGKQIIDPSNKKRPRKSFLERNVDMHAHIRRYLPE